MLFLLKNTLKYYKVLLFTGLTLFIFTQTLTLIPLAKAEGSYELVKDGGFRPYLLHANDSLTGINYKTTIKVFVNQGEQINVGSSVPVSANGDKDIVYFDPITGLEAGYCNVADDPTVSKPIGLIKTLDEEKFGPEASTDSTDDPQKYTPCVFTALTTGVYKIEFHAPLYTDSGSTNTPPSTLATAQFPINSTQNPVDDTQKVGIAAWDVTVFKEENNSDSKQSGRVYANYLPLYVQGTTSSINSQLFILSKAGHRYHIHLNGIQPIKFIFFSNNKGFRDISGNPLLKSVPAAATDTVNVHNPSQADDANNTTYKIFFNTPASDLPLEADSKGDWNNSITDKTWLLSIPPDPPTVSDFKFTGSEETLNQAGTTNPQGGQFSFNTNMAGNYILTIDANQNGTYGDNNDKIIMDTANIGNNTVNWDGRDGNNQSLGIGVYKAKLLLSDEVHFPFFDVEKNPNGLIIDRLTSCSGVCDVVYYDDSGVGGEKKIDGENSSGGAHKFNTPPPAGFGNDKGIDTWTSITAEPAFPLEIHLKEVDLEVTKTHSPDNLSPGSTVTYTITVESNDGPFSDVTGIKVEDTIPSNMSGVTWTCTVDHTESGNRCEHASGTGNINTTVDLTPGTIATFTVQGTISNSLPVGQEIKNTVTITTPNDVTNNPGGKTENAEDTITLVAPNSQPPTATDDSASTQANTAVTIPILTNDVPSTGSPLDVTSVDITTSPVNGTVQVRTDGTVTYTPSTDFSGTDTFTYRVCDASSLCASAVVTVTVASLPPPTQPPTANNDVASTQANTAVTIAVLSNDTDDKNSLNISSVTVTTPPSKGITQVLTDGTIKYTPNTNFSGTDSFTYQVCDTDSLCDLAVVTVTVVASTTPPTPPTPPSPPTVNKSLSIKITGKGTVTSNPGSINCHNDMGVCTSNIEMNTQVTLSAKPDSGWKFKEWKQDCDNNGKVTLSSDKQCEAVFVQIQQLTLTVFITGQGSVTATTPPGGINCGADCSNEYAEETSVVLKATPADGWKLEGWRGHCNEQGEVTLLETDKQCRAIFTPITTPLEPFKVTVYKTGQGTVVSEPGGINCGGICSAQYDGSHGVKLSATPDSGWKLEGWRGHCDENGQVVRSSTSYDHAQCRVIFLLDPSSVTPPPTPTDNTQPTNNDNNDQVDDNDNNQPNDNPSSQDSDHDGVSNSIENAAPNSSDGNNDGIPDSQQNNVISSPSGGQYVTTEEANGCPVQANQPAATTIDLTLSCSQANLKTYYHGISDYQNLPSFRSVSTGGNSNTTQTPLITYNAVMIQGQAVAVESVSLSDGGIGDSIAGDGKITYTSEQSSFSSNETQPTTTDSSGQVSSLPNDTTNSVSTIIGQEIGGFNPNNTTSQNTTTGVNNTASPTISRCLLLSSTTTQSSSWSQILQVGDTTTITLNTGPGEFSIKEMPDPTLVSVDNWKSLNGNVELSLTGLSVGDTQMTLSDSAASQQATLYITVIATAHSANSAPPLVEKEVKTLQTVVQVGQDIDLVVTGGQGSLTLTQLPNSSLVSLTHWQNQTNGTAYFTLTGLNIGNTNLVITDEATPPQKTNVNISILASDDDKSVIEPTITDNPENSTTACQGDTLGIDLQNRPNQACFMGKVISLGDLRSSAHLLTPTEAQNTRVTATVFIPPIDVGKAAKILLVGKHTNLNGETTLYIRDDSRDRHSWQKWNGQLEQIPPSQDYPQLPKIIDIFIYEGDLSAMPGEFTVFVGYQLSDDIIIYNGLKPIQFWVDNN